jgi:hypothetical protein
MEWINVGERMPQPFEMVILDTDKGTLLAVSMVLGNPNKLFLVLPVP